MKTCGCSCKSFDSVSCAACTCEICSCWLNPKGFYKWDSESNQLFIGLRPD